MPTPTTLQQAADQLIADAERGRIHKNELGSYTTEGGTPVQTLPSLMLDLSAEVAVTETGANRLAAEIAADLAESARDAALIQSGVYVDEPTGRAAVANGQAFKVQGAGDIAAFEYRRVDAASSTLISTYPSGNIVARIPRQVPSGKLLEDGSAAPPYGKVDPATGYYYWWIDAQGIVHDPSIDAQLDAIQDTIDESDLAAYKSVATLPGMAALTDPDGGDSSRTDADGMTRIAKLIRGDDPDYVLVEINSTEVIVYLRVGQPSDNYYLRYRWEATASATEDTWRWQETYLCQRAGAQWDFTLLFFYIGGGVQDIVSQEAIDSNDNSIDTGMPALGGFIGPSHGYEFKTRELLIFIDGVAVPAKKSARFVARDVRLDYQARLFRPRAAFNPLTAPVLATVNKTWRLDARSQLRGRHRIEIGAAAWTGFSYFPLITVPVDNAGYVVTDAGVRDYGFEFFALPGGLTSGGGTEPQIRDGVREMRYSGPLGGIYLSVGEPLRWSAAGYRRSDGALPCALDYHRIKGIPDPDVKTYWHLGGDPVNVGGTDYHRFNAGDRVERSFSVFITKN